jgi:hypothetical protein
MSYSNRLSIEESGVYGRVQAVAGCHDTDPSRSVASTSPRRDSDVHSPSVQPQSDCVKTRSRDGVRVPLGGLSNVLCQS